MLVLSRKIGESIILDGNIEIKIVQSDDGKVKVGINAPRDINIYRKEVYDQILEENKNALSSGMRLSEINKEALGKLNKVETKDDIVIKK